jgi:tRNA-specific adenosine deaminase 1
MVLLASANAIAGAVLTEFEHLQTNGKPRESEHTVLAGLVLQDTRRPPGADLRVVCLGTGTKCLGRRRIPPDGSALLDTHAEVIARRCWLRLLVMQLSLLQLNATSPDCILERSQEGMQKLRLKSFLRLHLYISTSPCGDASIFPCRADMNNQVLSDNFTGAPPSSIYESTTCANSSSSSSSTFPKEKVQSLRILRLKSGRGDIPLELRTLSMSCSCKLVRWVTLGLEGRLVGLHFEATPLASVNVGVDPAAMSSQVVAAALHRAVCERASSSSLLSPLPLPCTRTTSLIFPCSSSTPTRIRPCGTSLNWCWIPTELLSVIDPHEGNVEVVAGATGRRQGHSCKSPSTASSMSRLCKQRLAQLLAKVLSCDPVYPLPIITCSYVQAKESNFEGTKRRANFMRHVRPWGCWVVLDESYQQFPIPCTDGKHALPNKLYHKEELLNL